MTNPTQSTKSQEQQREHCRQCAFKSPLFKLLQPDELDMINERRHEVTYNPGELIFKQGAPLTHLLSFNRGLAKMQVEGPDGSRIILRLVKPVEFICGMGLFSDNRNQFSLRAVSRSSVCYIDKENFKAILQRNKVFMEAFLSHIEVFQARNLQKMINLGQKHSGGRVAEALLYLSNEVYQSDSFDLHLSTSELSELSGTSKESTFKVLSDFSNQGILLKEGSQISIKDRAMLEKVSSKG